MPHCINTTGWKTQYLEYYFLLTNTNHLNAMVVSNCVFWELYLTCKYAGTEC